MANEMFVERAVLNSAGSGEAGEGDGAAAGPEQGGGRDWAVLDFSPVLRAVSRGEGMKSPFGSLNTFELEKLLLRRNCVHLAVLFKHLGWNRGCLMSNTVWCTCSHEGGGGGRKQDEKPPSPLLLMQKRQCCKQARNMVAKGGKGRGGKQGVAEKAQWGSHHHLSALSPATMPTQPLPPTLPSLCEVPWSKLPADYGVISAIFKEVQNQNTRTKWEFLGQVNLKG